MNPEHKGPLHNRPSPKTNVWVPTGPEGRKNVERSNPDSRQNRSAAGCPQSRPQWRQKSRRKSRIIGLGKSLNRSWALAVAAKSRIVAPSNRPEQSELRYGVECHFGTIPWENSGTRIRYHSIPTGEWLRSSRRDGLQREDRDQRPIPMVSLWSWR